MRRFRTLVLVICLFAATNALAQIAPAYKKFGFDKPTERAAKAQPKHTARRKTRVSAPVYSGIKSAFIKPQRYDLSITILNENDRPLNYYPKIGYDLVQGTASKNNRTIASDFIGLNAEGKATLTVSVPEPRYQTGIILHLPDQKDEDPEYEFVDSNKTSISLPLSPKLKTKTQTLKPIAVKPLVLNIRRNVADLTIKGVPPGCKLYVDKEEVPIKRLGENNDRVQVTLPIEVASNKDLQLHLTLSDDVLERKATVDAGELLAKPGNPVTAYSLNSFEIPDNDWIITRIGFSSVALSDVKPAFGNIKEIALYTDEQVRTILGAPDKIEPVYAFSKTDGSEWLVYINKGISLKVRELNLPSNKSVRVVEQVKLVGANAGKIGGIGVGNSSEQLYNRLGNGQTSEVYGKPRAGYRSYLSQGLQYSIDAGTSLVSSIEIWRPYTLLMDAFLPKKMALSNKICIVLPTDQLVSTKGSKGSELSKHLQLLNEFLITKLKSNNSVQVVDDTQEANAIVSWHVSEVNAEDGKGSLAITVSVKQGDRTTDSSFATSANGPKDFSEMMSKLATSAYIQVCDSISNQIDCYSRIKSVDYLTGEIEIELGKEDGLVAGYVFEINNIDLPAFPDRINVTKVRTKFGSDTDSKNGARLVLLCTEAGEGKSIGHLAYLVMKMSGNEEQTVLLDKEDWQQPIRQLLDPGTGLLYTKLRLVAK